MSLFRPLLVSLLALALGACATTRPVGTPVATDAAEARQQAHERSVSAQRDWGFDGRLAVATGDQGGSGRIEWRQQGDRFDVVLSAPITRQGWRLSDSPEGAVLLGLPSGPRSGPDADALLRQATGWDVPVTALAAWVRGVRAPGSPATVTYSGDGRLAQLRQSGWTIDYTWPATAAASTPVLPTRIEARRDTTRVRLAVDRWIGATDVP